MRTNQIWSVALALGLFTNCAPKAAIKTQSAIAHAEVAPLRGAPKEALSWANFDDSAFVKARAEKKFVIMDGSAEWCHWCHVMEAETYHDPKVAAIVRDHFIATKVDIDSRPDIEERYSDYGWPATVIFSADGREIGKYRGFISPEDFAEVLSKVVDGASVPVTAAKTGVAIPDEPISEEELAWIKRMTELELNDYWDAEFGGWGHQQKVAIPTTNAWELARARAGDPIAKTRILLTLEKQKALLDPVWSGIYQYSTDGDWVHPHFEKLMFFNAGALDNYAEAYEITNDRQWLDVAKGLRGYLSRFLKSKEGGFFATQDADLNAHDPSKPFRSGHDYYSRGEKDRLALGLPRIDEHEYARENGLAIRAYCTYARVSKDTSAGDEAARAADRILATHSAANGGLSHAAHSHDPEAPSTRAMYLADQAAFLWGLLSLHDLNHAAGRLTQAIALADFVVANLEDKSGGGFFSKTEDDGAGGIFADRRKPFEDNVLMLRSLAKLARLSSERAKAYKRAIDRTLRAIATPDAIKDRGRFLGDFLLALDETKDVRGQR